MTQALFDQVPITTLNGEFKAHQLFQIYIIWVRGQYYMSIGQIRKTAPRYPYNFALRFPNTFPYDKPSRMRGNIAHLPDQESIMKVVNVSSRSLLPESVRNLIESANCATRIILKTCEGTERAVTGLDEVTTIMLRQQQQRLLAELSTA